MTGPGILVQPWTRFIPYKTLVYLNVWEIKVDQGRYFKSINREIKVDQGSPLDQGSPGQAVIQAL